jgi:DNA repair exonuclease SbcCD ATPase subunit
MLSEELSHSVAVALAGLQALDVKAAAALPAKVAQAKKDLAEKTQKLEKLNAELAATEAALERAKAKNRADYAAATEDQRAQLEAAWIAEEKANRRLGELEAAIRDKRALHDGLVAAMAELVARLEGKGGTELIERIARGEFHA